MSEKKIEGQILIALNSIPYILAFKHESQGQYDPLAGHFRARPKLLGVPSNGAPDIIGFVTCHGVPVSFFLEVKTPKGKQSEAQKKFQSITEKLGGFYFVVTSVSEAMAAIGQIERLV